MEIIARLLTDVIISLSHGANKLSVLGFIFKKGFIWSIL